ncbi:MAG: glycosyl hydrolase family 18, partial [Chitinophagaceae bacterium]
MKLIQSSAKLPTQSLRLLIAVIGLLASLMFTPLSQAETKVIGYIPSWKGFKTVIDATDLSKLTHINISFLNPDASGAFVAAAEPVCMENGVGPDITYLVEKAHAAGVKVLVSVAGGVIPDCSGNWATLLQPASRQLIVDNLLTFVETYNLDGVDVDLEGALLTAIDNAGNYTPFIKALSDKLKPESKLLTCATATYEGGMIPLSSIPYFDFVNIMSYDAIGPSWGVPGAEQSTFTMAQNNVITWQSRGLTKEQLVLGVPFYGYGFGTYDENYDFRDIINLSDTYANQDLIGTACAGCSYITYNG